MMERRGLEYFKANWSWKGWKTIMDIIKEANASSIEATEIVVGLFSLGCRAMELPTLKKKQVSFTTNKGYITISNLLVQKQKTRELVRDKDNKPIPDSEGNKQYVIMPKKAYRTFTFPQKEPTSKWFTAVYEGIDNDEDFLFPYNQKQQYYRLSLMGAEERGLDSVNKEKWNDYKSEYHSHLFRSLRACEMIRDYPQYRSLPILAKWFGWADLTMPNEYLSLNTTDLIVPKEELSKVNYTY